MHVRSTGFPVHRPQVFLQDGSKIPCLLLANKCDLPEVPERTKEELDAFCAEHDFIGWFHTSSKENVNIEKAYKCLVEKVLENDQKLDQREQPGTRDRVALGAQDKAKKKTCC